jgi:hypothetical protein
VTGRNNRIILGIVAQTAEDSGKAPTVVRSARLRPVDRGQKFVKLRALKCFDEVHQRILEGYQIADLARYIQDECNEYTDVELPSLQAVLQEYRESFPPAELIQKRLPRAFGRAKERVEAGLDELQELEDLYRVQRARLQIDFGTEKKINKLLPSMTQEMRAAREILKTIADLKMDLGLSKRHIGSVDVNAHLLAGIEERRTTPEVAAVLQHPEKRRRLLALAGMLAKRADEDTIEAEGQEVEAGGQESVGGAE